MKAISRPVDPGQFEGCIDIPSIVYMLAIIVDFSSIYPGESALAAGLSDFFYPQGQL